MSLPKRSILLALLLGQLLCVTFGECPSCVSVQRQEVRGMEVFGVQLNGRPGREAIPEAPGIERGPDRANRPRDAELGRRLDAIRERRGSAPRFGWDPEQ